MSQSNSQATCCLKFDNFKTNLKFGMIIPSILMLLYIFQIITLGLLKVLLVLFLLIFIVFPLIYKYSYSLQRNAVFLNFVNWPKNPNLSDPSQHGVDGARNFYLTTDDGITLGVWEILSESSWRDSDGRISDDVFDAALKSGQNVILYNHGNSGTRAASHRIELYQKLRKHFHVFTYDYRSYGDSSPVDPTEDGLVKDVKFMYNWITNKTKSKLFIWGHSLGTGLSLHALSLLNNENKHPYGIILESPFNNMRDEVVEHPISQYFKHLPWFYYTVVDPMQENNFNFRSDFHIMYVDSPILILHAEDDKVVPFKLGKKLYDEIIYTRKRNQGSLKFIGFKKELNFGHKYICRAENLDEIIDNFVKEAILENEVKKIN